MAIRTSMNPVGLCFTRVLLLLTVTPFAETACGEAPVVLEDSFDGESSLSEWRPFLENADPAVTVMGAGLLHGRRSPGRGLVALSRPFPAAQRRIAIEFSFAVSEGNGRVFHIWTQSPDGRDASQLNLAVQNRRLQQFDGRSRSWENVLTRRIEASADLEHPVWYRLQAIVDAETASLEIRLSEPDERALPAQPTATLAAYRTGLPIGGLSFVSGQRIAEGGWYLVDDLAVRAGDELHRPAEIPPLPEVFALWSGPDLPDDPEGIPFADGIEHSVIHRPGPDDDKFLHGAAILEHDGVLYANWANSPVDENSAGESLRGKRSYDGGRTWSDLEIIAADGAGPDRHSHGVLFEHDGNVWTICARFGVGESGEVFRGLQAEAFVLDNNSNRWHSRGIVMNNCWPYDQPVRMGDGNSITGGQDRDGLPVVAISQGDRFEKMWDSVLLPFHSRLSPSFAETTVWAEGNRVLAVIRGGRGVAWVATSEDCGRTWTQARPSNLPMPRAKAYLGKLSTGQLFLVSNYRNRDTLVITTGHPGELSLSKMWRLRHGRSAAPHYAGRAKGPQWSYPYAYEHDGRLWVVYSIGKEECGLTVVPVASLTNP